jgi:hypothetical protein
VAFSSSLQIPIQSTFAFGFQFILLRYFLFPNLSFGSSFHLTCLLHQQSMQAVVGLFVSGVWDNATTELGFHARGAISTKIGQ